MNQDNIIKSKNRLDLNVFNNNLKILKKIFIKNNENAIGKIIS